MSNTPSNMLALGTKAPDFKLPNPSKNNELQSLESLKGKKGTLVVFMCNHCPFVLHIIDKLEELYEDYKSQGIEFIAINSNDVDRYPADSPEMMVDFVDEINIQFPYLNSNLLNSKVNYMCSVFAPLLIEEINLYSATLLKSIHSRSLHQKNHY